MLSIIRRIDYEYSSECYPYILIEKHYNIVLYPRVNIRMKFRILREICWSILTYIILFIKLTIKMINSVQKNIFALSLNKNYGIALYD